MPAAPAPQEARRALEAARQALLRGDQGEARRMARMAARLFPTWDAPWLLLAAVSAPRAGLAYAVRALYVNPRIAGGTRRRSAGWSSGCRGARAETVQRASLPDGLTLELLSPEALAAPRRLVPQVLIPALLVAGALVVWLTSQPAAATQTQDTLEPVAKATFTPRPRRRRPRHAHADGLADADDHRHAHADVHAHAAPGVLMDVLHRSERTGR